MQYIIILKDVKQYHLDFEKMMFALGFAIRQLLHYS